MCTKRIRHRPFTQAGASLIELIMFILIVGMGVVAMVRFMANVSQNNVSPMIRKQGVAIAESLLEEILLQPFTICEPETFVPGTGACGTPEAMGVAGVEAGQSRYSTTNPFNNVNDYAGFTMPAGAQPPGIYAVTNGSTPIPGLEQYSASVNITDAGGALGPAGSVLRIDVTVTLPNTETLTLTGYRFRYAPDAMP